MISVQIKALRKLELEITQYNNNFNLAYTVYAYLKLKCIDDLTFANMVLRTDKRLSQCISRLGNVDTTEPEVYAQIEAYYKQ